MYREMFVKYHPSLVKVIRKVSVIEKSVGLEWTKITPILISIIRCLPSQSVFQNFFAHTLAYLGTLSDGFESALICGR